MSALSKAESVELRLARIQHTRPETALKTLRQEHQLITKMINAIERLRAIRGGLVRSSNAVESVGD
jgi:hypothetical protein